MQDLTALTPDRLARAVERLRNPAPGGRIEAAREYGIDLTLLIEQLLLTPTERLQKLQQTSTDLAALRGIARRP